LVCVATEQEAGRLLGAGLDVLVTGVGPVHAAIALTRRLAGDAVERVVCCGVGGAYPGSGLEMGAVVSAESEQYGDFGADSPDGFIGLEEFGLPGRMPLDLFPTERRAAFVTCALCTGTDARAKEIAARTGGAVESMEGAALVEVARRFHVPIGEVRGISNEVGNRDRASWRITEAAAAAQEALLAWL
jgi:futalosine hydrolase